MIKAIFTNGMYKVPGCDTLFSLSELQAFAYSIGKDLIDIYLTTGKKHTSYTYSEVFMEWSEWR